MPKPKPGCKMVPVTPADTVGLRCETHRCEPMDPCLHRTCPHCGSAQPSHRQQALLIKRAMLAQALVERLERRSLRVMRALVEAREKVSYYRKKIARLDETLDTTDADALKKLHDELGAKYGARED